MTTFVPYQVDYSTKNTSKTFGFSKKRVSFKFGFANNEALSQGLTGAHCRGSEHEVIFVWSLNSGKRQILADGKDVHFSESGQNGWTADQVFQHQFNLRVAPLSATLRCHLITQPVNRDLPGQRPFDLRINGISFFTFSKIFQLGTSSMITRPVRNKARGGAVGGSGGGSGGGGGDGDPFVTPEERKAIAAAKLESLKDLREREAMEKKQSSSNGTNHMQRDEGSLISFDDPVPTTAAPQARGQGDFMSSVTMDPSIQPPNSNFPQSNGLPPPHQPAYNNYALPPQYQTQSNGMAPATYPGGGQLQPYYQPGAQTQQQQQQQQQQPPYGGGYNEFAAAPAPTYDQSQQAFGFAAPPQSLTSPSNQSFSGQTVASYGSAPSFAQPPRQQTPQQQQQQQQQQQMYQQQPPQPPSYPPPQPNYAQQPQYQYQQAPPHGYPQPHY